jgi:hypothetical protein
VTMRTKLARTVVKSVTASLIALNNETSPPTSSAVSVVTLGTWREIVQIGKKAPTGVQHQALLVLVALQLVALVLEMPLTENTRWVTQSRISMCIANFYSNLCKNSLAVRLLVPLLNVSRLALVVMIKVHLLGMMWSHGNGDLLVLQLLGNNEAVVMIVVDMILVMLDPLGVPHLGRKIVDVEVTIVAITMVVKTATTLLHPRLLLLPGNKLHLPILPPLPLQVVMLATLHLDTALATIKQAWVHLLVSLLLLG